MKKDGTEMNKIDIHGEKYTQHNRWCKKSNLYSGRQILVLSYFKEKNEAIFRNYGILLHKISVNTKKKNLCHSIFPRTVL